MRSSGSAGRPAYDLVQARKEENRIDVEAIQAAAVPLRHFDRSPGLIRGGAEKSFTLGA